MSVSPSWLKIMGVLDIRTEMEDQRRAEVESCQGLGGGRNPLDGKPL
jgi:hypothetical protein